MLRIRLRRVGKKKQPSYRIVIAEARTPREGPFVEIIGQYNPLTEPTTIQVDAERAREWLRRGAQPSDTVQRLFQRAGVLPTAAQPASPTAETVQ